MLEKLRNIAIVAHVDHGKTTLVDRLLQHSTTFDARSAAPERLLDTDDLERERGITILSKNTTIDWNGYRINIVDTPGHADFGGEVERILSMVDSVLLLVDAVEGPMPQTRFVTQKAFAQGLKPIVVINKIDRPGTRVDWVLDQTFDLFDRLGATDEQLDFPVVYTSALKGYAQLRSDNPGGEQATDMTSLLETIAKRVPAPDVDLDGPFQMQISSLSYSSYVGAIGIGRVSRGQIAPNSPVVVVGNKGQRRARILQVLGFDALERVELESASAGDIVAVTGIEEIRISDTLCDPNTPEALPQLSVDEPTVRMTFRANDSPFAGREGTFVTSRQLLERLERELIHNVALRVETTDDPKIFLVSGRGELHLSILIENMRREGYELAVGRPQVILKEIDGVVCEPFDILTVDFEESHQGTVMEMLGSRRGDLRDMQSDGQGRVRLDYIIPSRGLIGFRTDYLSGTSGTGLLYHSFDHYAPFKPGSIGERGNGALVSIVDGKALGYSLFNLQDRGRLIISPGEQVYEGMVIGIHSRASDLPVNPTKAKQLTNIRAAGTDENIILVPPIKLDLESALELIDDDELVEVTPKSYRLRKVLLKEMDRRRAGRTKNAKNA